MSGRVGGASSTSIFVSFEPARQPRTMTPLSGLGVAAGCCIAMAGVHAKLATTANGAIGPIVRRRTAQVAITLFMLREIAAGPLVAYDLTPCHGPAKAGHYDFTLPKSYVGAGLQTRPWDGRRLLWSIDTWRNRRSQA